MSSPLTGEAAQMLAGRLVAVQDILDDTGPRATDQGVSLLDALVGLAQVARVEPDTSQAWLLIVGLTGAMPGQALVRSVTRALALKEPEEFVVWMLDAVAPFAMRDGNALTRLRVVTDRPVVDVNHTAKSDFLTGIQRVVRGVVSQWHRDHDVELVVWTARAGAYRSLHESERERLLAQEVNTYDAAAQRSVRDSQEIVVPWAVPVILTEVPGSVMSDRLAAVAEFTHASLRLVGYDCIPVASAETVPLAEPEKFGRYLELVKFSERVAGISEAAAAEFRGFSRSLSAQGLSGPQVVCSPLPTDIAIPGPVDNTLPARPVVLCVGTVGRRKNQVALVEACEMLWREGLDFEARIFGHVGAENTPWTGLVPELQAMGRPLVTEPGVSDARISNTLAQARCLVFPSLHEGFGLPVVEALSQGVPVITSDFGSMREIAEGRGGILVDPEDVRALTDALRLVLTDDVVHTRLVDEALDRPTRTWPEYAAHLWSELVL